MHDNTGRRCTLNFNLVIVDIPIQHVKHVVILEG